jgi:hypothetical protein
VTFQRGVRLIPGREVPGQDEQGQAAAGWRRIARQRVPMRPLHAANEDAERRAMTAMMRAAALLALFLAPGCVATSGSSSSADDRRWIAQCLRDNRDARVSSSVVRAYCTCMNDRMPDHETRSITQWERANPRAREACERRSGWH